MKNSILEPKPAMTSDVCKHKYVDSRQTSRHQKYNDFKSKYTPKTKIIKILGTKIKIIIFLMT
jgi:hypothetical protein